MHANRLRVNHYDFMACGEFSKGLMCLSIEWKLSATTRLDQPRGLNFRSGMPANDLIKVTNVRSFFK